MSVTEYYLLIEYTRSGGIMLLRTGDRLHNPSRVVVCDMISNSLETQGLVMSKLVLYTAVDMMRKTSTTHHPEPVCNGRIDPCFPLTK